MDGMGGVYALQSAWQWRIRRSGTRQELSCEQTERLLMISLQQLVADYQ